MSSTPWRSSKNCDSGRFRLLTAGCGSQLGISGCSVKEAVPVTLATKLNKYMTRSRSFPITTCSCCLGFRLSMPFSFSAERNFWGPSEPSASGTPVIGDQDSHGGPPIERSPLALRTVLSQKFAIFSDLKFPLVLWLTMLSW